ncbi:MAG: hypothetical protein JO319_20260 [Acidobacteriaceae bacterium]|nr:hypothetical protein [Acidobacteriaceae bacterium]
MNRPDLQESLSRLADSLPREAGPAVERNLLVVFRAQRSRSRRRFLLAAATAACLVAALFGWFATRHPSPAGQEIPGIAAYESPSAGFVALPYAESDVPIEEAVIVRVQVQRSELRSLGVPLPPPNGKRRVSAEFLVGQDGIARAVRLTQ